MINIKVLKNAPKTAGVYLFKKVGLPLYVGKAANLKKRLASYFRKNASEKILRLVQEATKLEWIETESEIEALLKEAELIKKYRPKYNILMRDDKNYFYVGITRLRPRFVKATPGEQGSGGQAKEEFPRIFVTHQPAGLQTINHKLQTQHIGPFTSGSALKETLRLLRRIFPYCTCAKPHKRQCLNSQIGRCFGYCCLQRNQQHPYKLEYVGMLTDAKQEYVRNIQSVVRILQGKQTKIATELKREMRIATVQQDFERAAKLRDQIAGLENVFSHRQFLEVRLPRGSRTSKTTRWYKIKQVLQSILGEKNKISRVEGYDISNISGTEATGSMAVFIDGRPAKSEYRKFKIKTVRGANDVAMLKEVIGRRLRHGEWSYPDVLLIDGGKPQLSAARAILRKSDFPREVRLPKVAALAKKEEELYTEKKEQPIRLSALPRETALFLQRVRDESHRFAKKYHHKLREKLYRGE